MTPTEVAAKLRQFNDWRRGHHDDAAQPDPREIGEAIDAAIEMIERLEAAEKSDAESIAMYRKARDERDAMRAKIEAMEKQEPVAWGAFYFGGKLNGKLYSQCDTEAQIDKYIVDRHRSDDSNTFRKAALYAIPGALPAPSFADAYQGAMEDVAIWKKRALEAEDLNRKFVAEINGPAYMGEPAQPAPIIPEGWKLVPIEPTETMVSAGSCASSLPGPHYISEGCAQQCWKYMLAAAPEAKP